MALRRVYKDGAELRILENLYELRVNLAEYIAHLSDSIVKERGVFSVAMSGGSLIDLMRHLCASPYDMTIEWSKWHIFLVEERIVSRDHEDSIRRNIHENFVSKVPMNCKHAHYVKQNVSAKKASKKYEYVIRQHVKSRVIKPCDVRDCPEFDLILLVMGEDGHVASLFPNHPVLEEKNRWVTFITHDSPTSPPPERVTLTLPVINSASNVAVIVTGTDKAHAVHLAFQDDHHASGRSGSSSSTVAAAVDVDDVEIRHTSTTPTLVVPPAKFVRPREGNLVWFLDQEAASKLDDHPL